MRCLSLLLVSGLTANSLLWSVAAQAAPVSLDDASLENMDFDEVDNAAPGLQDDSGRPAAGKSDEKAAEVKVLPSAEYRTTPYREPQPTPNALFRDTFQTSSSWEKLNSKKFTGEWNTQAKRTNEWVVGDAGLKLMSDSAYHGLVKALKKRFDSKKFDHIFATLEVQYEKDVNCGGAYFKLFDSRELKDQDMKNFDEMTQYSIMFGPDRCGYMTNKVHMIVKFDPLGNEKYIEEHLLSPPSIPTSEPNAAHQFGFALHKDGRFELWQDGKQTESGKTKDVFKEHFSTEKMIDDPEDRKPADWVDEKTMPDKNAVKPDDWDEDAPKEVVDEDAVMPEGWLEDEPAMVPNPEAVKPHDWNEDEDGEWVRPKMKNPACKVGCGPWKKPMKPNPNYKGKWQPPMIDNPDYKGEWEPRKIPNPDYYEIENPWDILRPFDTLGFELWTVESGALLDNILITDNETEFKAFIDQTYNVKASLEADNWKLHEKLKSKADEEKKKTSIKDSKLGKAALFGLAGAYSRIVESLQTMANDNKYTFTAAVGLPVAAAAYLLNRMLRRLSSKAIASATLSAKKKTDLDDSCTADTTGKEAADSKKADEGTEVTADGGDAQTGARKRKGSSSSSAKK